MDTFSAGRPHAPKRHLVSQGGPNWEWAALTAPRTIDATPINGWARPARRHFNMNLVFDGSAHPLGLVLPSLLALIPLGIWAYGRFVRPRPTTWLLPIVAAVVFFGINGIQLWDQVRVRKMLESGEGLHITEGRITQSWHIESRVRDWTKSNLSYKRIVSEGFDVGGLRFRWNVGDGFSPATFSNGGQPAVVFTQGMWVQVTWFVDRAAENERRIIRLRMGEGGTRKPSPGDTFEGFRAQFLDALSAGDVGRLNALTRFPVAFGTHAVDQSAAATLWAGLMMPGLLTCLPAARPEVAPDGGLSLACHRITLVFRRSAVGWQLHEVRDGT